MRRAVVSFITIIYFLLTPVLFAQSNILGSWNILNLRYSISDSITLFGEGQLRSLGYYKDFHYHEWKVGALYQIEENCNIGLGFGKYDTYQFGGNFVKPKDSDEWRLWPQVILKQKIFNCGIEHRYRLEFRWFPIDFRFRARYRLSINREFNWFVPTRIEGGTEVFFGNRPPYFERTRLYLSTTLSLTKSYSIYFGYVHQFDYQISDETGRDFLQFGLFFRIKTFGKMKVSSAKK
jgi:hypothetical protein